MAFTTQPNIIIDMCCNPCNCGLMPRVMSAVTGNSCEGQCLGDCIMMCIPCLGACCYGGYLLGEARKKYGIKGTNQLDCVMGCIICLKCLVFFDIAKRVDNYPAFPIAKSGGAPPAGEEMER